MDKQWYEAEAARSGRSKCKKCTVPISEGELRIGIKIEEHDHWGDCLGWYHPNCLWKTFYYPTNPNPRIAAVKDITNFASLDEGDQQVFRDLIAGRNRQRPGDAVAAAAAALSPSSIRGSIQLFRDPDGSFKCTGDTFSVKDVLKQGGARWDGPAKAWVFPETAAESVNKLFGLTETPQINSKLLSEARSVVWRSQGTALADDVAPAVHVPHAAEFAMAGIAVFLLDQNTQTISLSGHVQSIGDRLRAEGGVFSSARGGSYSFPTMNRGGARRFLCMPDDLPPSNTMVEIDLAELGRKQASQAGVEISPIDQERAEERLRFELNNQNKALLEDALAAVARIVPNNRGDFGSRRSSKRVKRGTTGDEVIAVEEQEEILKRASVEDLSYEERLQLEILTVPNLKKFLSARGLSTSGVRSELEARFLLAGARFEPIENLDEYMKLAHSFSYCFRCDLPTRKDSLIDNLFSRFK